MMNVQRQRITQSPVTGLIGSDERIEPTLTRYAANPVFTATAQNPSGSASSPTTAATIYWPYIVKVSGVLASPINAYYMYYSTDHGSGGIWLATAPTAFGPWTGQGRKYNDSSGGSSTETPSVIWNDDESLFFMYYQQAGASGAIGTQSTCLATSPDGVTWTRVGIVLDKVGSDAYSRGDGHTGYFRPFRIGRQWYAYSLFGGGNDPDFAISTSHDGRTWFTDPRLLSYSDDIYTDSRRIEWNSGDVVMWRGRLWWIGMSADFTSGSNPKDARITIAPLASDLRRFVGKPRYQLYPTAGSNESTNYRALMSHVDGNQIVTYYQCDANFNIATAG